MNRATPFVHAFTPFNLKCIKEFFFDGFHVILSVLKNY